MLHRHSRIGILARFFVSFGSWIGILAGFFVSFGFRIGILVGSFASFGSWIGILDGFFVSFSSRIRIPAGFLLLRARHKSGLYKNGLIFYRDNDTLYGFSHMVASRNGSSFLFLMKEKNQKKIKAMIAIYFYLVHVVNGRCLVRLGKGRAIFAEELLLCSLYMRKKRLHFFSIVLGVCFKNMF